MSLSGRALAHKIEVDRAVEKLGKEFAHTGFKFLAWSGTEPDSRRGFNVDWQGTSSGWLDGLCRPEHGARVFVERGAGADHAIPPARMWLIHPTLGAADYGVDAAAFSTAYEAGKYIVETMLSVAARKQLGEVFP